MLGLTLREEFQGRRLKGTAIELTNRNNTGATQVAVTKFLRITYPSGDVLKAVEPRRLVGTCGRGENLRQRRPNWWRRCARRW